MKHKHSLLMFAILMMLPQALGDENQLESCKDPYSLSECKLLCEERWVCFPWESCLEGNQFRECIDQNNCNSTTFKPKTEKGCGNETIQADKRNQLQFLKPAIPLIPYFAAAVGLSLLGIISFLAFRKYRENKMYKTFEKPKQAQYSEPKHEDPAQFQDIFYPEIEDYVSKSIQVGYTKQQVKEALVKAGWDAEQVDKVLEKH